MANANDEQAKEAQARAAEAREAKVKGVDERLKARDDQVADYYDRMAQCRPTPTQRECDLIRVGALDLDDKEDDGSEWQDDHVRRIMMAKLPGENPYETRAEPAESEGEPRRRGPGRPRKSETTAE